jgi:hypothetical protein
VLFVSFSKDDELQALRAGSSDFLKRPSDYDVLKARLNVMLNSKIDIAYEKSGDEYRSEEKAEAKAAPNAKPIKMATAPKKNGQNNPVYLLVAAAACFIFIVVGLVLLYSQGGVRSNPDFDIREGNIPLADFPPPDENAIAYSEDEAQETAWPYSLIQFYERFCERVVLAVGSRDVRMALPNPSGNRRYFVFEVALEDTEETLYKSGLVAPGMCINGFALNRELQKGEHKAELIICSYDIDSFSEASRVTVTFDIDIE